MTTAPSSPLPPTPSTPTTLPSLGRVGYAAYGYEPGPHGPWTTFDGRPMPRELGDSDTGVLTRRRWDVAAEHIVIAHERRQRDARAERLMRRIGIYSRFKAEYDPEDDSFLLTARDGSGEQEHMDAALLEALELVEPREMTAGGAARHCLHLFGVELDSDSEGRVDPFLMGLSEITSAVRDLAMAKVNVSCPADQPKCAALHALIDDVTAQLHARVKLLAPPVAEDAEPKS